MVMSGPHDLGRVFERNKVIFSLEDSPHDWNVLIESSFYQEFWGFQKDYFEFLNKIYDWMEAYYLEISIANNKFRFS